MSEKRFPASLKQLREAKQRGDTPRAALLTKGAALLCGVLALRWQGPALVSVFQDTPWLSWSALWWSNLKQLSWSLALILGSAALGAYLLGSLAGGFVFSAGALRGNPGLERLSPKGGFFLSLGLSWVLLGWMVWGGSRWLSGLSWAGAAPDGQLAGAFLGDLAERVGLALALATGLGGVQATLSWYFWRQRHQRTSPQFMQDSKDEEGKAKQFFSSQITEQKKRPG